MCKKTKKLLICMLICAILSSLIVAPQSAMAADVLMARETFDLDVLSNCWSVGTSSGVENGVFKSGGTDWNTFSFTPISNVAVYRFRFMQPEIITTDLCRAMNSTGGTVGFRIFTNGGNIQLERNGNTVITLLSGYQANTWYDVCAIAPYATNGTAYINGVASGNFFAIGAISDYAKMQTFNRASGITYFDDIEVCSYATRADAEIAVNAENDLITRSGYYSPIAVKNVKNVIDEYRYVLSTDEATEEELTSAKNAVADALYDGTHGADYIYQNGSNYVRSYRYAAAPITNVAVLETNFSLRPGGYEIRIQQVWDSTGSGRPFVISANTSGTGNLYIDNGTGKTISTDVAGDTWHNLISVVDIPNKKINVYFNGKLVYEGEGLKNDVSDIGIIEMQTSTAYCLCNISGPVLMREFDDFDAVCAYIEAENELGRSTASSKTGYAELKAAYDAVDTAYIWKGDYATAANTLKNALTSFKANNFAISSRFTDADGNTITKIGTNESVVAKIEATHCDNTKKAFTLAVVKYAGNKMDSIKIFENIDSFKGDSTTMSATLPTTPDSGEFYKIFVWKDGVTPVVKSAVVD